MSNQVGTTLRRLGDARSGGLLADLSVPKKLYLLVLLGCSLAGLVLVVGVDGLSRVNTSANSIYQDNLKPSATLTSINTLALQVQSDVASLGLASGNVAIAYFKDRIAASNTELDQRLTEYRRTVRPGAQETAVNRFSVWWSAYRVMVDKRLVPAATSGDAATFQAMYLGEGQMVTANAMSGLTELVKYEQSAGAHAAASAHSTYISGRNIMVVTLVVGLLLTMIVGRHLAMLLVKPIKRVSKVLVAVAKGDLTAQVTVRQRDDVGRMASALTAATESMRTTVRGIAENASTLAAATEELSTVSLRINESAMDTAHSAGEVADAAAAVSQHVNAAAIGAEQMGASIQEISRGTSDGVRVAASAVEIAEATNKTITKLGISSSEIGEVVKVITSIAEQTNLLALNATIEAARAGDAGKGFAVVAGEVKDLSQETSKATEGITNRVNAIQADSGRAVAEISEIGSVIAKISEYQLQIASAVEEQRATTQEMSRSVNSAATDSAGIAHNIASLAKSAKTTTDSINGNRETAADLAELSTRLTSIVSRFQY